MTRVSDEDLAVLDELADASDSYKAKWTKMRRELEALRKVAAAAKAHALARESGVRPAGTWLDVEQALREAGL